ncbi:MAG: methionyl-tRNA formyltransferase [Gammaproteobacteria bacterium]|nr:methionyl-tRNA formyltransferase [Gammaproteobacteria bacterium]
MDCNSTHFIASQRPWNAELAGRLAQRTGQQFMLIQKEQELSIEHLTTINPRYIFFPHWSKKIEKQVWQNYESIIFHMTDVPYGRGGSPLQNLIMRGHKDTVISALRCVEDLDAGDVYLKYPLSLHGSASEIFYRADRVIEEMIVEILETQPHPQPQSGEATPFKRCKPENSNLIDANTLSDVFDKIRMLDADGYPSAFLTVGNFKLEFTHAEENTDHVRAMVNIKEIKEE